MCLLLPFLDPSRTLLNPRSTLMAACQFQLGPAHDPSDTLSNSVETPQHPSDTLPNSVEAPQPQHPSDAPARARSLKKRRGDACTGEAPVPLGCTALTSCISSLVSRILGYRAVLYWVGFGNSDLVKLAFVSTAPTVRHRPPMFSGSSLGVWISRQDMHSRCGFRVSRLVTGSSTQQMHICSRK